MNLHGMQEVDANTMSGDQAQALAINWCAIGALTVAIHHS